jgi:drug/metabolite transporter, DME family
MSRLQVLLASLCFGTTGTAQALGPAGLSPAGVGAARILVGGVLLVLVALLSSGLRRLPRGPLLLGALAVAAYQLSFFAAVSDTGVAVGTIIALGSGPAFAGAVEWAIERRVPSRAWATATALACAGVAMLALSGADAAISPLGVLLALVAGASYAAYTYASKRMLAGGSSPEAVMAGAFGLAAVLLLPVLLITGPGWVATSDGLALALFLGVVPTAAAYLLFARGLKRLSAAETATLTLAEPLTATLLGAVLLHEHLTAATLARGALLLLGLAVLALPRAGSRLAPAAAA